MVIFNQGACPLKAAKVLNATIGFTIGDASIKVTPHETGSPLLIKRRIIGTIPHSQTGKHNPSKPLAKVAKTPFLGSMPVMILEGIKAAIAPEIKEPTRTNGKPSNASAKNEYKKFCHVKVNQLIAACSDPIQLTRARLVELSAAENRARYHGNDQERNVRQNDGWSGWEIELGRSDDSKGAGEQSERGAKQKHLTEAGGHHPRSRGRNH